MPKMKTHRGARKRFSRTARGRFRRQRTGLSHLLAKKPGRRKRRLRRAALVSGSDERRLRRLLPYF